MKTCSTPSRGSRQIAVRTMPSADSPRTGGSLELGVPFPA